jgi:quercetin dioxygenase-like cupin family protein
MSSAMTMPGTVRTEAHADPVLDSDGRVTERVIIDGGPYAEPLIHRTHRMATGTSTARHDEAHDELLYVMDGAAVVHVSSPAGDDSFDVAAGDAVQVQAGERVSFEVAAGELHLLSFLVPAPTTPWAAQIARPVDRIVHVARLGEQQSESATADRQFEVLFDRHRGSRGATMFVGFIPTSGAPEHYHLYDEICVIVRGSGFLHALGRAQPIGPGSAFHVAPRLLHAIENPNAEDIWILGVFRPEGSAAAAFYPDGRPAPSNED